MPSLHPRHYRQWGKSGIRAQLFDIGNRRLEMDFVLEQNEKQSHLLNAVSPAWTGSLSLGDHVAEKVADRL